VSVLPAIMKVFAGPPGTGKTYRAAREAVLILRPGTTAADMQRVHQELVEQSLITWVTFHPSYSYEDFVEGFRPTETPEGNITYSIVPGPFLRACATASMPVGPSRFHVGQQIGRYTVTEIEPGGLVLSAPVQREDAVAASGRQFVDFWTLRLFRELSLDVGDLRLAGTNNARRQEVARLTGLPTTFLTNSSRHAAVYERLRSDPQPTPVVLVIDEINRADLSRVFGELITLLEFDKREGGTEAREVTLTYSGHGLTVPAQLSVIGTMNTADKSLSAVDLALRRRFEFVLMPPEPGLTPISYGGINVRQLFTDINRKLAALNGRENLVGHADFMRSKMQELAQREGYPDNKGGHLKAIAHTLRMKTLPFLVDLFRNDWNSVRFVLGQHLFEEESFADLSDEMEEFGEVDSSGMWRLADWWNPADGAWDSSKVWAALGTYRVGAGED
jgi:5-methylcytosine-specific restriction protein B